MYQVKLVEDGQCLEDRNKRRKYGYDGTAEGRYRKWWRQRGAVMYGENGIETLVPVCENIKEVVGWILRRTFDLSKTEMSFQNH